MILSLYESFRHWSYTGGVYLIGDLNFSNKEDRRVITEEQVNILNNAVYPDDTLVVLGNVGNAEYMKHIRAGRKVLIMGRQDTLRDCGASFSEIYRGALIISEKIILTHEPVDILWCLNIHGSKHNGMQRWESKVGDQVCRHLDLSAEACNRQPVSLNVILKKYNFSEIPSIYGQKNDPE